MLSLWEWDVLRKILWSLMNTFGDGDASFVERLLIR